LQGIDHIGIAVRSIEETIGYYTEHLKMKHICTETIPRQGVRVAILDAGNCKIELLEPLTPESPVQTFLKKRGEGLHHIALKTAEMKQAMKEMEKEGIQFVQNEPQEGAMGKRVIFIHPRSSHGVLVELCEKR
jgi:methylmalonyl-CoA epimerase